MIGPPDNFCKKRCLCSASQYRCNCRSTAPRPARKNWDKQTSHSNTIAAAQKSAGVEDAVRAPKPFHRIRCLTGKACHRWRYPNGVGRIDDLTSGRRTQIRAADNVDHYGRGRLVVSHVAHGSPGFAGVVVRTGDSCGQPGKSYIGV